ncbi:8-oxo-dGTP diphosphatase [Candidatus Parcubacteria bacterium]|nr:8-oxo-dGTP diphosphatase [Candidatus Parcubacteria bacterium]
MKQATLCFLVKEKQGKINEICLAMKKRGFGVGRWNGFGGKVKEEETIEQAMERETEEESRVDIKSFYKVAELTFFFSHNPDWDQQVHAYFCKDWVGEPQETEEMKPQWFLVSEIPFDLMWQDDIYWLPEVINKKLIKGTFSFDKEDKIVDKEIEIVDSL